MKTCYNEYVRIFNQGIWFFAELSTMIILRLKQNSVLLAATFLAVVEVQASEENKYFSKENLQPENILSHLTQVFTSHSGRKVCVCEGQLRKA